MNPELPESDVSAGLLLYSTIGGRHDGELRGDKDSFRVEEVLDVGNLEGVRRNGYVPVYRLTKRGLDTPHAARILEERLRSKVSFAGMKDSNATTVQYVSARSSRSDAPPLVKEGLFQAELLGFSSAPIRRAMIVGNRFTIRVATAEDLTEQVEVVFAACRERRAANFFGYQRFGLRGASNGRVGKAIVVRDFKEAVRLVVAEERPHDGEGSREARRLASEGRYAEALGRFSKSQDIERRVAAHLAEKPEDHLGALRRIPLAIRRLFVHAYQAYLFNLTLSRALRDDQQISRAQPGDNWAEVADDGVRTKSVRGVKETPGRDSVPLIQLVGYAFRDYRSRFDRITVQLLDEEGVRAAQFYIKEADEMSSEGSFRQTPLLAKEMSQERAEGGHLLSFTLGKGEYATVLLREVLKPSDPLKSGF